MTSPSSLPSSLQEPPSPPLSYKASRSPFVTSLLASAAICQKWGCYIKACWEIVLGDDSDVNIESLATKYPIVDRKTHILAEDKMYYQIIRADGSTKYYKIFSAMLDDFDRQDVLDLYRWLWHDFCVINPNFLGLRMLLNDNKNIRRFETVVRLQEEFDEEERQMIARVHEAARSFSEVEWEDIRGRVKAFEELVQRLQTEEREKYIKDDQAKMLVDLINQRIGYFAVQKAEAKRNMPITQAQLRTYMSNYKHMGDHKLQQLKRLSFDEIKDLFKTTMRRANTFVPMETEIKRGVLELVVDSSQAAVTESTEAGGTKIAAEEELGQQSSKKQKSDELSQEELQQLMIIVPKEGMNIEALQTKYPIID
ncbi:hypothetical protein Tco_1505711 [Tanacetum coccineum]